MSKEAVSLNDLSYTEPRVLRDGKPIYVRDYPGAEPALVLMHGFPDALELYDFLIPHLAGKRRVIAFDFIGWGQSDKSPENVYTFDNLERDLDCVITQLGLEQPDLVAHDASGPPAIEWAIKNSDKVGNLILLNTVYMMMLRLRPPEGIFLYMMPLLKYVTRFLNEASGRRLNYYLYDWQIKRFIRDKAVKNTFVPYLYEGWKTSWPAFRDLVGRLFFYSISRAKPENLNKLRSYPGRVRIIFGARDPYLNIHVARKFHQLFYNSDIFLLDRGYHYVQVDEPEIVARLILELREPEPSGAEVEADIQHSLESSLA
jgi:pimeloyl-ACP methyl ester carboxylesterase